jgi:serine/threonine protein kinase
MIQSPSIITCKDKIIKYSTNNITFFENEHVFKQFPFNGYKWVSELINVNTLNHPNIIKFKKCEFLNDFVIDSYNKEICLDKKEKVVRITMDKYTSTLENFKNINDHEIFIIVNGIISAVLYCHAKHILHRDIKESNVFVKYILKSPNGTGQKKRELTDVVLADFNISKYKYKIQSINRAKIMTISHRSPEISTAILNNHHLNYDDRIDVWSFCIMISFLITGKSFYSFLNDGYLSIDPSIIYSANKLQIALAHFIKIYASKKLIHLDLYKKIIYMGIREYKHRSTFTEIYSVIETYITSNQLPYTINKYIINIFSPEQDTRQINIGLTKYIRNLHGILQNNTAVLVMFLSVYGKMIKNNYSFNSTTILALYVLSALLILDEVIYIEYYIMIFSKLVSEKIYLNSLELSIIKIITDNNFNLF